MPVATVGSTAKIGASPPATPPGGPRMPHDPRHPELAALVRSGLTRRRLLGAAGSLGGLAGAALRSGCAPPAPPASSARERRPRRPQDLSAHQKTVGWANWTPYLDYDDDDQDLPHPRGLPEEVRPQGHLQRGRRGQRLLLQQGGPAAARRAGHRPRHLRPHGLDGQPRDPRAAGPAPRPHPDAAREQPARVAQGRRASTPGGSTRSPGRAASPASATTRRPSAASSRRSTTCGPTTSRARSWCSASSATPPG